MKARSTAFSLGLLLPLLVLLPALCSGQFLNHRRKSFRGGAAPTYIVNQNFEGTGYDNSETWTEAGSGTVNEDYTAAPIVGSQSLQIVTSSSSGYTWTSFTQQDTVRCEFRLNVTSFSGECILASFLTPGLAGLRCKLVLELGGTLRIEMSTGPNNACTDTLPTGTPLWVAFEYNNGTGADATASMAWSTTSTIPAFAASGAKTAVATGGGESVEAGTVVLGTYGAETITAVYDVVTVQ